MNMAQMGAGGAYSDDIGFDHGDEPHLLEDDEEEDRDDDGMPALV
jgi:hypothetical protein